MSNIRLASRQKSCVDGFRFEQKQTGWKSWEANPNTLWDFNALCLELRMHRMANPKFKLPTDIHEIQEEVDHANALRMTKIQGAESYYVKAGPVSFQHPLRSLGQRAGAVVAATKKVSAGVGVLADWLGAGLEPVAQTTANNRAAICTMCPQNQPKDITSFFTQPIADKIRKQIEIKKDLELKTTHDASLGVCVACSCPLPLKVHVPLKYIQDHMTAEVKSSLDPLCWITKETP